MIGVKEWYGHCFQRTTLKVAFPMDIAKVLACQEGIRLAKELHLSDIILEPDCSKVTCCLNNPMHDHSYLDFIVLDI